ncbi:MAG TPA: hypothetical protein VK464_27010 [Symbiobacteriaceae bacterium]|nr:hypothetical protein [Symbiobacteriaceae bacterium]
MTEPTTQGSQYLQRLIRQAAAEPAWTAAYAAGALAAGGADPFAELDLCLTAPGGAPDLAAWLSALGETAFSGPVKGGWRVITPDGLSIRLLLNGPVPAGAQVIFHRTGEEPGPGGGAAGGVIPDLEASAARFWHDLYQAGAAIGREQLFTAHGHLERCRAALLEIYRLALAPGQPGTGWDGLEALPGAGALDGLKEWLVSPLELRAQWRCMHKLASSYESLTLPLLERLGLTYPWAMRNLVFARIDEVHPDRPRVAVDLPKEPEPEPTRAPAGPARFKIKRRGAEGESK